MTVSCSSVSVNNVCKASELLIRALIGTRLALSLIACRASVAVLLFLSPKNLANSKPVISCLKIYLAFLPRPVLTKSKSANGLVFSISLRKS